MAIQFRGSKGSSLTHNELDQNFREFFYSASVEGSNLELHRYTATSSSISVPLSSPVGRNGAIQFKLGSAVSGANAQFTGSQNLTFVQNTLKVTGSILLDTQNEVGILEVTGSGKFSGNLTVGGTLTAEEFVTERNTTIQIYNSGSTIFGDSHNDVHERTGSLNILGAFNLNGSGSVNSLSGSFSGSYQGNVRSTDTIASGSFSGSLEGEGSGVTGIISSSYAVSASIAPFGGITGKPTLLSSSIQIGSDISGSFTLASSSIATKLDTRVTTASAADNVITFTKGTGATFNVTIDTGSTSGINSVVADTTPQLGGNLDLNTKTISGSGTISMVGNISGQQITGSNVLFTNVNATGVTSTTLAATSGITGATLNTTGLISGSIIKSANAISGSSLLIQGTIKATGDVTAFHSSDARLKDNITPIKGALDKIKTIGGYEFDWNNKSEHTGHDVGVIAQEIEFILPELVVTRDNGYKAVRYEKIVALLIEALKEQQLQIDELKSKL
jgi:hypothetical protein